MESSQPGGSLPPNETPSLPEPPKPDDVLIVHTMDDFRTNCTLLESALAVDLSNPIPDLAKLTTWIDWLEAENGTPDHVAHFFGEAIPRITRALLKRRYHLDNNRGAPQARAVHHFFHRVLRAIVILAPQNYHHLTSLLDPLFDESQSFYQGFGHEQQISRMTIHAAATASSASGFQARVGGGVGGAMDESWKDSLVPGSHLQVKRRVQSPVGMDGAGGSPRGLGLESGWTVVTVLEVSPTGTEVKVELDGGEIKWYSLDDPDVAAPGAIPPDAMGEDTVESDDQQMEVDQVTVTSTDLESADEDADWRIKLLEVGSMCDAMKASPQPVGTTSTTAGRPSSQPEMWYQAMVLGVKRKEASLDHLGSDEVLIGMVGWHAGTDHWLTIDSKNLAPLNSKSKGHRGTGTLRPEMLAAASNASLHILLNDAHDGQVPSPAMAPVEGMGSDAGLVTCGTYAVSRENTWTSTYLIDNLNFLGGLHHKSGENGFVRVLDSLHSPIADDRPIRFDRLATFLVALGRVANLLTVNFLTDFVPSLQTATVRALKGLREDDMRLVTKDMVDGTLAALEALLRRIKPRAEVSSFIETLLLDTILSFFHSSIFNRRLDAIRLLVHFIRMAQDSARFPAGIRAILVENESSSSVSGPSLVVKPLMLVEYQLVPIARAVTSDQLAEWMETKAIVACLYDRRSWHDELIERCSDIAIFLAQHGRLSDRTLEVMWAATHCDISYMEKPACAVLMSLCNNLGLDHLKFLFDRLSQLRPQEHYRNESIDLLRVLCRRLMQLLTESAVPGRVMETESLVDRVLAILWEAGQDGNGLTDSLAGHAIKALKDVISNRPGNKGSPIDSTFQFRRFEKLLMACVENVRNNCSVEPALEVLRCILSSFPKDQQAPPSDSSNAMAVEAEGTRSPPFTSSSVLGWLQASTNFLDLLLTCIIAHQRQSSAASSSRVGHLDGLQSRLDALAFFLSLAAGSPLSLSQQQLHLLWRHLYLEAQSVAQRELFLQWLVRALVSDQERQFQQSEGDEGSASSLLEEGVIRWLFTLISDADNVGSDHFSEAALSCLIHLFLKINSLDGKITMGVANRMLMVNSPPSSLLLLLHVQVLSLDLTGLDALWSVYLHALQPVVVNRSIEFITRLAQRLSRNLLCQGMLPMWRKRLLDRCMCDLKASLAVKDGSNVSQRLLRSLAFLDTLLNESAPEGYGKVRPHSGIRTGAVLRLNLGNNVKNSTRPKLMQVVVYKNDTVADLIGAVASQVGRPSHELRVFRGGRELTEAHRKSTLGQLGVHNSDALLVCLRMVPKPIVTNSTDGEDGAGTDGNAGSSENGEIPPTDVETLPMKMLSSRAEYFELFFQILDRFLATSEEVCQRVWRLLQRLPTNADIYQQLLTVGMESTKAEDVPGTAAETCLPMNLGVPKLLYALQLVQYLVMPAEDAADLSNLYQVNPHLESWLTRFVQQGGILQLYRLLTQHPHITSLIAKAPGQGEERQGDQKPSSHLKEGAIPSLLSDAVIHLVKVISSILERCSDGPAAAASPEAAMEEASHTSGDNGSIMMDVSEETACPQQGGKGTFRLTGKVRSAALANVDLANLQECAMNQAWTMARRANAGMSLTVADGELAIESLKLWHACCRLSPTLLTQVPHFVGLDQLLVDLLLCRGPANVAPFIRRETVNTLLALCELAKPIVAASPLGAPAPPIMSTGFLSHKLIGLRPNGATQGGKSWYSFTEAVAVSQELYSLLNKVVLDGLTPGGWGTTLSKEEVSIWAGDLADQIVGSPILEVEGDEEDDADHPLKGALELLSTIVKNVEEPVTSLRLPPDFSTFLLKDCLFGCTEMDQEMPRHPRLPKCACRGTRQAAYGLLVALCGTSEVIQSTILDLLVPYHERVKLHPSQYLTMAEKAKAQEDDKKASRDKDMNESDQDCSDLWGCDPSRDRRASVGYAGLRNLGCICYMNALLQQLYMIPAFRQGIMSSRWKPEEEMGVDPQECVLSQLQRMFGFLTLTTRKAYYPARWCRAFKDESGNPTNVRLQQDAVEFLQSLCDRLEYRLGKTVHGKDLVQSSIGGLVTNQLIRCPRTGRAEEDIRESDEPFYCIQLKVQDQGSLEASLREFIQGETISDFRWDDNDKEGTKIIKRVCIKRTSDTLIFHLKRFEFDFDTLRQGKLNDEFRFPMTVDIYPYTKEGLAEQEDGSKASGSPTTLPRESYMYELVGVVVHTGTADSGHYYSFIRERQQAVSSPDAPTRKRRREDGSGGKSDVGSWLEFNDSTVRPYDISQLAADCFGGSTSSHEYDLASKRNVEKVVPIQKNAYMLVYSRCSTSNGNGNSTGDKGGNGLGTNGGSNSHPSLWWPLGNEEALVAGDVWREVLKDSAEHLHHQKVFSKEHLEFVCSVIGQIRGGDKRGLSMAIHFVLHLLARAEETSRLVPAVISSLASLIVPGQTNSLSSSLGHVADALHHLVYDKLAIILDMLLHCPVAAVRKGIAQLLLSLCQATKAMEGEVGQDRTGYYEACAREACRLLNCPPAPVTNGHGDGPLPAEPSPIPDMRPSVCHVLVESFLHDMVLNDLVTNWSRCNELLWFLLSWAELGDDNCAYLVRTKAVCKLADIFLGVASPLNGCLYPLGSHKTAPLSKSIASKIPTLAKTEIEVKEDDNDATASVYGPHLPSNSGNFTGPDWTHLLQLIALLATKAICKRDIEDPDDTAMVTTTSDHILVFDQWSRRCLIDRNLYGLAMMNAPMYWRPISDLACRLVWDWLELSNDVMAALVDSLSAPELLPDDVRYIFNVVAPLLEVDDGLCGHRVRELLSVQPPWPLSLWRAVQLKQTSAPRVACVVLLSILSLARRFPDAMRELQMTQHLWGPHSLEFLRGYCQKCRLIAAATQGKNVGFAISGVVIWGDGHEDDGDQPWHVRLDKALSELETFLGQGKGDSNEAVMLEEL